MKYYYDQSGCLPFQYVGDSLKIFLITSRKNGNWIIPKGIIEDHLSPVDSAIKEAYEEAGIEGTVIKNSIGNYKIKKWNGICSVDVFPLRVETILEDWIENTRERKWFDIDEAIIAVKNKGLKKILKKVKIDFAKNLYKRIPLNPQSTNTQ